MTPLDHLVWAARREAALAEERLFRHNRARHPRSLLQEHLLAKARASICLLEAHGEAVEAALMEWPATEGMASFVHSEACRAEEILSECNYLSDAAQRGDRRFYTILAIASRHSLDAWLYLKDLLWK